MTDLLKQAFDGASKLPEQQQDSFAEWILKELDPLLCENDYKLCDQVVIACRLPNAF